MKSPVADFGGVGAGAARPGGVHAVTGFDGGAAKAVAEVSIHVDCTNYGIVEDLSQTIMHALARYIRQSRMSAGAISTAVFWIMAAHCGETGRREYRRR